MNKKTFYIYEWYNENTNEVFYVGKGCGNRYKDLRKRNQYFLNYYNNNLVDVRIVWEGTSEEMAFEKEKEITSYYKSIGQCGCNLAEPGHGGKQQVWTEEMRKYKSIHNPMKRDDQRQRMINNNPMKNKEIAQKNGNSHKRAVIIGENEYAGLIDAAKYYNVDPTTIANWIKRKQSSIGLECRYKDDNNNTKQSAKGTEVIVDGIKYSSIAKAATAINVAASSLRTALNKNRKCKGHQCEYVNQQPSQ